MTHIIIKTSKAKVLHHRDQLVAEATAKKELVGYSDDHVETADGKYVFRVMPVAMPMEVLNQIYDLGNVEGDADVSDVVRSLESDIAKIHEAIAAVVKAKPTVIGTKAELPTFTGNKIENPEEVKTQMETGGKVEELKTPEVNASEGEQTIAPDAKNDTLTPPPASDEGNNTNTPNPQA